MSVIVRLCRTLWNHFTSLSEGPKMPAVDPEVQRIIDAAEPGVLDVLAAYERFEPSYMVAAHVHQSVITSGTTSSPPTR